MVSDVIKNTKSVINWPNDTFSLKLEDRRIEPQGDITDQKDAGNTKRWNHAQAVGGLIAGFDKYEAT